MNNILTWLGIIISIALIICTIMQETKTAPIPNYGGNNNKYKQKGKEAILNNLTKILGILLFINTIMLLRL